MLTCCRFWFSVYAIGVVMTCWAVGVSVSIAAFRLGDGIGTVATFCLLPWGGLIAGHAIKAVDEYLEREEVDGKDRRL